MTRPRITVNLRAATEREAIDAAAEQAGEDPSRWARRVLLEAAGAPTAEPPEAEGARRMRRGERDPWRVEGGDGGR